MGDKEQPGTAKERLRAGDTELFSVPVLDHPVTVNEFHAQVLGLSSGILLSIAYTLGFEWTVYVVALGLVGYALFGPPFLRSLPHDMPEYGNTVALRTVRWEPWHFLALFVSGIVAFYLFVGL